MRNSHEHFTTLISGGEGKWPRETASVNSERLFGNEDFQLLELAEKVLFQLGNESRAPQAAKVQHGHDDNQIEVKPAAALPNSLQREIALQRS